MNYAAVLSPVFDRHNLASAMREAFLRMFTVYPPRESDLPTFRRITSTPALSACLKECRITAGNASRHALYHGTSAL